MDEKVKEFYTQIATNKDVKEKIFEVKEKYKNVDDPKAKFYKISNELLIPLARHYGFDFTVEDLLEYEKQAITQSTSELGDTDLEAISGGFSAPFASICLSALMGISSLTGIASTSADVAAPSASPNTNDDETQSSYSYIVDEQDTTEGNYSQTEDMFEQSNENVDNDYLNMKNWITGTSPVDQTKSQQQEDVNYEGVSDLFKENTEKTDAPPPIPERETNYTGISDLFKEQSDETSKPPPVPERETNYTGISDLFKEEEDTTPAATTSEEDDSSLGVIPVSSEEETDKTSIPPPPPPPPLPITPVKTSAVAQAEEGSRADLLAQGTQLKHVGEPAAEAAPSIFSQIRDGKPLRHVDPEQVQKEKQQAHGLNQQEDHSLEATLRRGLASKFQNLAASEEEESEETLAPQPIMTTTATEQTKIQQQEKDTSYEGTLGLSAKGSDETSIPPPPPPPITPVKAAAQAKVVTSSKPESRADLLAQIQKGPQLKRVGTPTATSEAAPTAAPSVTAAAAPTILSQIQAGTQLKHVDPEQVQKEKKEKAASEKTMSLEDALKLAVEASTKKTDSKGTPETPKDTQDDIIAEEEWAD